MDASVAAVITTDTRGRITSWSDGAEQLYGWPFSHAAGKSLANLIGGVDARKITTMWLRVARDGARQDTVRARHRDGLMRRVEVHSSPMIAASGEQTGVASVHLEAGQRENEASAAEQSRFEAGLLDHIESIVVAGDARGRVIHWNDAAANAYGYTANQALGYHINRVLKPVNASEGRKRMRSLRAGQIVRADFPVVRRDGSTIVITSVTSPMFDAEGNYQGWIDVAEDVTERRLSDARLGALMDAAPCGVVLSGVGQDFAYVNQAVADLAGVSAERLRGRGWRELVHPDDLEQVLSAGRKARATGQPTRMAGRVVRPDGSARAFVAEYVPILAGGVPMGSAAIVHQVARASAGGLSDGTRAHILDEISNAVVVTGLDGIVTYWNSAAERQFGWLADDVIGRRTADLGIVSQHQARANAATTMRDGRWVGVLAHTRQDGTQDESYVTTSLVLDSDGNPEAVVSVGAELDPIRNVELSLELQSQVVAAIEAGMWLFTPTNNRMEFVNTGYERMFGVSLAELHADHWAWLASLHPDDQTRVRAEIESKPIGSQTEYRVRAESGGWRHVQSRTVAMRDAGGTITRVAGIATDITSLRLAELKLGPMALAIQQTRDGVLVTDPEGRTVYANEAFMSITGLARDEVVGTKRVPIIGSRELPRATSRSIAAAVHAGRNWDGSVAWTMRSGSTAKAELAVWPISGPDGAISSVVYTLRQSAPEADRLANLDRDAAERGQLAAAMAQVDAGANPTDLARGVVAAVMALGDIDVATAMAFVNNRLVMPLAAVGPPGIPIEVGKALPLSRARFLRLMAEHGGGVVPWVLREIDGDYGRRWADVGVTAVAYMPLIVDGEVAGLLTAGSVKHDGMQVLERHMQVLSEHANLVSALLGPHLRQIRSTQVQRETLANVLSKRQFSTVFQPIIDPLTKKAIGFEALTRFLDGTPPQQRFLEAEALDVGLDLETATLQAAAAAAHELPAGPWLSLNVSPDMVGHAGKLRRILREVGRPVVIEITEHAPVADYSRLRRGLASLGRGVRFAVDDAGAGFASMRHIVELRPDFVKIDIGLVRGINRDKARQALVAGMVHFATTTGCTLIAEGIETAGELRELRRLGVRLGQGYLLGRPVPASALAAS